MNGRIHAAGITVTPEMYLVVEEQQVAMMSGKSLVILMFNVGLASCVVKSDAGVSFGLFVEVRDPCQADSLTMTHLNPKAGVQINVLDRYSLSNLIDVFYMWDSTGEPARFEIKVLSSSKEVASLRMGALVGNEVRLVLSHDNGACRLKLQQG